MKLFELQTGGIGESYVRSYAWAGDVGDAVRMFREKVANTKYATAELRIRELFDATAAPFCTEPDDAGWPEGT
jgi:hypothetical protein